MELLSFAFVAVPYVLAMATPLVLAVAVVWLQRSFAAGSQAVVWTLLADEALPSMGGLQLGVSLYLPDFVFFVLAIATILRIVLVAQARTGVWAYYVLLAVMGLNAVQGLGTYGTSAGVDARPAFYSMVACGYAMSFPMTGENLRELARAVVGGAVLFLVLAAYRAMAVALDIRSLLPASGSFQPAGHSVWRVIASNETLLLAQAALLLWYSGWLLPKAKGLHWLAPLMLGAVLALQHRSVWLATLVGLSAAQAMVVDFRQRLRRLLSLLAVCAVAVVAALVVAPAADEIGMDVGRSARDAVELRGTAGERLGSWQQLIRQWAGSGPRVLALGNPFGKTKERYTSEDLGARKIAYQAHNYFVELLWGQGAIGLAAWLFLFGQVFRALWRARLEVHASREAQALMTLLACQAAYYVTYGVDYVQSLILGAALSWMALRRGSARPRGLAPDRPAPGVSRQ